MRMNGKPSLVGIIGGKTDIICIYKRTEPAPSACALTAKARETFQWVLPKTRRTTTLPFQSQVGRAVSSGMVFGPCAIAANGLVLLLVYAPTPPPFRVSVLREPGRCMLASLSTRAWLRWSPHRARGALVTPSNRRVRARGCQCTFCPRPSCPYARLGEAAKGRIRCLDIGRLCWYTMARAAHCGAQRQSSLVARPGLRRAVGSAGQERGRVACHSTVKQLVKARTRRIFRSVTCHAGGEKL